MFLNKDNNLHNSMRQMATSKEMEMRREFKKLKKEFDHFEERCKEIKRDFYETIAEIDRSA